MSLANLIRGTNQNVGLATATLATFAIDKRERRLSVATVASVSVAKSTNVKSITPVKVVACDTATASRWWLIHHPDRDSQEVACYPEATHAEILERYPDAVATESFTPTIRQPSTPMAASEEMAIRAWLALIEETDPVTIAEVISRCQRDADARDYFTGRATAELPKSPPLPDDRRTCSQCLNLRQRVCSIAKPERGAMVVANRGYRPDPARLLRCAGYAPMANDLDQRTGAVRWPGLTNVKGTT